jgi:hypothetical protein
MKINCKKYPDINDCPKIRILKDKDYAGDWQFAESVYKVCRICGEGEIEE